MSCAGNTVSVLGGARVVPHGPPDGGAPGLVSRELCHDLRQPLAAMMITASSLLEGQCDPATVDGLRRIQAQVSALDELVQATLTAARPQFVSASYVVESVVSTAAIGRGARIDFFGAGDEDAVFADVTSLGRAVANLVENAVRAAGEDGAVRVDVVTGAESVDVIIADTGPGFGSVPRNTGLGLVIVRDFVAEQRGALEFGESGLGGAEVRLRMPSAFVQTRLGTAS